MESHYHINLYSLEIMRLSLSFFDKKREHLIIKYEDMYKNTKFFFNNLSKFTDTEMIYTNKLTFFNSPKVSDSTYYSHDSNINKKIDEFRYKKSLLKREINLASVSIFVLGNDLRRSEYNEACSISSPAPCSLITNTLLLNGLSILLALS